MGVVPPLKAVYNMYVSIQCMLNMCRKYVVYVYNIHISSAHTNYVCSYAHVYIIHTYIINEATHEG